MNISKLLDFIRAMKKFNRKQVFGAWYAIDKETGEVCGCALGQAVLNLNWVTEEEIKRFARDNGIPDKKLIYDPVTGKKEERSVITCGVPSRSEAERLLNELIPTDFRSDVMTMNDRNEQLVDDIAAEMYSRYAS